MICAPTDKKAGVTFPDVFMHQLHSGHVAADFPLVKAAPATSIRGKGDNCERSGMLVPQLCWDMPCSVAIFAPHGKAEKPAKAQSPSSSEKMHVYAKQGLS